MQMKSFVILLHILMLHAYGMRHMINIHSLKEQPGREVEKTPEVNKIVAAEEKGTTIESENMHNLRDLSANATELIVTIASNTNERALHFAKPGKSPGLAIKSTRPSTLFGTEAKPFNILNQLKLDEIRDAQTELLSNPGRIKALKKKKKKKKKKRKKNKKKQKPIGEEATIFYTQLTTKKPHYYYHKLTTTKVPKKIKYIVRKKNVLKKKKKEYLNHLKHVFYPFIKFVAFFTVLNPFTLKVFIFALISPVVFGFLGFMALSFMVKPALHLIFDVKKRVDIIKHKKWLAKKRRERWRYGRRPITIHKHYYKNVVVPRPPKPKPPSWPEWVHGDQIDFSTKLQAKSMPKELYRRHQHRKHFRPANHHFNPILPEVEDEIEDWPYGSSRFDNFNGKKPLRNVDQRLPSAMGYTFKRPHLPIVKPGNIGPSRFQNKHPKTSVPSVSAEYEDAPFTLL
ncbi:uncharacterized protein LOC129241940 [Anastrepha obliqua]|uniref:uncharacterized protein LOC129241940 n=1 Tax=Anastrepha obliqua TaxID=95512 RepID=UPI00240A5DFF|nr:uncharacterized protein LOC129241940 [Anastrepha obliqua]